MKCDKCNKELDLLKEDCIIETINCRFNFCLECQLKLEDYICEEFLK